MYTGAMSTTRDTAKVSDRRDLHFESFAAIRGDLDSLEEAHRAQKLRATGNWSAGAIFSHLAAFMEYPYEGYPPELGAPPWFVRAILKLMKNKYLYKPLPAGVKIPGVQGGTVGAVDAPFDQSLGRLRAALARMDSSPPTTPNVVFGPMTHEEWRSLQCRHCELHLSFLHPM